ncbi:MAG: hypothetical protein AAGK14_05975 [Verrucomicrobiota bacterium]
MTREPLHPVTQAHQLIRCEEMLRAAQSLVGDYRRICQLYPCREDGLDTSFFGHMIEELEEQIQLIQYQLFTLGWTEQVRLVEPGSVRAKESRVAYALLLSRVMGQEKELQKAVKTCLKLARGADYTILAQHLSKILDSSLSRTENLLNTHASRAA